MICRFHFFRIVSENSPKMFLTKLTFHDLLSIIYFQVSLKTLVLIVIKCCINGLDRLYGNV